LAERGYQCRRRAKVELKIRYFRTPIVLITYGGYAKNPERQAY
jgi:hypothetical protein